MPRVRGPRYPPCGVCIGRLQGGMRYDYMDVIGGVESGTETEKTYGTGFRAASIN